LESLCEDLLSAEVERGDVVIALGGGVIGDLTGFAASILRRGCRFVQAPTTLLAQVDSSVGGKTGINTRSGKNLVGSFHQPSLVLADTATLATLPLRELRAGYAEVVKYGLINDAAFFAWCEANGPALLSGDAAAQAHAIAVSCQAKAAVVAADERETLGLRALLNLGHTFGHALEAEAGYGAALLHGEAVAIGMMQAFDFSVRLGLCPAHDARRVRAHLEATGLPTSARAHGVNASGDRLVAHMAQDKKKEAGKLPFILARGIGQCFLARDIDLADVARFLDQAA
jgi:3-dehydroquinate synthase